MSAEVATGTRSCAPAKNEDVCCVVITGYAFPGLSADTGDTQPPAEAKRSITIAGAVDEFDLRLKSVPAWRKGDRDCEVARARLQIRRKFLAETLLASAPLLARR